MTVYNAGDVAFFLADGFSLLPYTMSIDAKASATTMETSPLGVKWETKAFGGVREASIAQQVIYDDAALATNAFIRDSSLGHLAKSCPVCWGAAGNVAGRQFFGYRSMLVSSEHRGVEKGQVALEDIEYTSTGNYGREEGVIIVPEGTAVTAAGNSTGVDAGGAPVSISGSSVANPTTITTAAAHGLVSGDTVVIAGHTTATAVNGTWVVTVLDTTHFTIPVNVTSAGSGGTVQKANGGTFHVQAEELTLGGYTNVTVALQGATTLGGTYSAVSGASTAITSSPSAVAVDITAGTLVPQFVRVAYTLTGSGSNPSLKLFAGFARH